MKLAIISDIHGNSVALKKVIEDYQKRGIEEVILLGDYMFKGPDPHGVLELLKNLPVVCCLKGNTDKFIDIIDEDWIPKNQKERILYDLLLFMKNQITEEEMSFIRELPETQSIYIDRLHVLCVHGSPRSVNEGLSPEDSELKKVLEDVDEKLVLAGHIHRKYMKSVGNKVVINPGSVGLCNMDEDDRASYGVLHIKGDKFEVEFVKVEYSHQEIIDIGSSNNFPHLDLYSDWIKNY